MKIYAIIPARGGSKGVPGKNIRLLLGRPLIAWTVEEAKKTPGISRVIVNTDDEKIAAVARQYGAEVYQRPASLGGDLIDDLAVFKDHMAYLKKENDLPDAVVDLRPTAPLRGARRIHEGIRLLVDAGKAKADSVRAVSSAAKHPYKMWQMENRFLSPLFSSEATGITEPFNAPRQILPPVYQNNGAMNAFWPETVLEKNSVTGEKILGFVMDDWESVNIDTEFDFQYAEYLMKKHDVA